MLVETIFSLFKVNEERANSLFIQVQSASSLTDGWHFAILQWNQHFQNDNMTILI